MQEKCHTAKGLHSRTCLLDCYMANSTVVSQPVVLNFSKEQCPATFCHQNLLCYVLKTAGDTDVTLLLGQICPRLEVVTWTKLTATQLGQWCRRVTWLDFGTLLWTEGYSWVRSASLPSAPTDVTPSRGCSHAEAPRASHGQMHYSCRTAVLVGRRTRFTRHSKCAPSASQNWTVLLCDCTTENVQGTPGHDRYGACFGFIYW